jgi:hypothetical protein
MQSMSWVLTGLMQRAREREQARRVNEAYARWHKKHRELLHTRDREQERRLLGTRYRERNDPRGEDSAKLPRTPLFCSSGSL